MTKISVVNLEGKEVAQETIPASWAKRIISFPLIHQVAIGQEQNRRIGRADTKGRAERRGGGRKPWRQKGTGLARHGSRRSPIWRKGGVTFGPSTDRTYGKKIPESMKRAALRDVLLGKVQDEEITLIDQFPNISPKTKELIKALSSLTLKGPTLLLVSENKENRENIRRASNNIPNIDVGNPSTVSVSDLLYYANVLVDRAGWKTLCTRSKS